MEAHCANHEFKATLLHQIDVETSSLDEMCQADGLLFAHFAWWSELPTFAACDRIALCFMGWSLLTCCSCLRQCDAGVANLTVWNYYLFYTEISISYYLS